MYNSCRSEKFGSNRGQIYIGVWLTEDHWTDNDWVGNLRMSKVTFQKLCEELAPFIERRGDIIAQASCNNIAGACRHGQL